VKVAISDEMLSTSFFLVI